MNTVLQERIQRLQRNPNGLVVVSSAAAKRIRTAMHRAAMLWEHDQATKHLAELRRLTRGGASIDEIEQFVAGLEAASGV